jgi:hypothetical protein
MAELTEDGFVQEAFHRISAKMADTKNVFKKVSKLTVYEMIRYTPMNIRLNRKNNCRVYFYNSEFIKREGKRGLRTFAYKTGCNQHTYLTQIGFLDYKLNLKSPVWVSCQCDYYKYQLEWVNTSYGASDHTYALNQPPVFTNPHMVPGACKHILSVVDDAMKRTRQFARLDANKDLEVEDTKIDKRWDLSKDYTKLKKIPSGKDTGPTFTPDDNKLQMREYNPNKSVNPDRFFEAPEPEKPEEKEE